MFNFRFHPKCRTDNINHKKKDDDPSTSTVWRKTLLLSVSDIFQTKLSNKQISHSRHLCSSAKYWKKKKKNQLCDWSFKIINNAKHLSFMCHIQIIIVKRVSIERFGVVRMKKMKISHAHRNPAVDVYLYSFGICFASNRQSAARDNSEVT
jgi:hypothetical protein